MPFKTRMQAKACFAQKARNPNSTWDCREWAAHTPGGIKSLPKGKKKKTHSEKKAEFVMAFVDACLRDGVADPTLVREKAAAVKAAFTDEIAKLLGGAGSLGANALIGLGALGSVGLPYATGMAGGVMAGHAKNQADAVDLDSLRQAAVARAYRRKADELKARREAFDMQQGNPDQYKVLG